MNLASFCTTGWKTGLQPGGCQRPKILEMESFFWMFLQTCHLTLTW